MDRLIEVKVFGNHLTKDNKNAGTKGEANITRLRVTFDEGWDGYVKEAIFWDAYGENAVRITLTTDRLEDIEKSTRVYICPIPAEAMARAGLMTFAIYGYLDGKKQVSIESKLEVKDSPDILEPVAPTPTQVEQQMQVEAIIGNIQEATIASKEASESAENAKESAEKAETAVGKTSYIGENGNWYAWDGEKGEFYDTGVKAQAGSTVYYGDNPPDEADVWVNPDGSVDTYTKEEVDGIADTINDRIDTVDDNKADKATTLSGYGITDAYNKDEVDNMLSGKATKSSTLEGYGITDAYTKSEADEITTEINERISSIESEKADKSSTIEGYGITDVYTKEQSDRRFLSNSWGDDIKTIKECKEAFDRKYIMGWTVGRTENGSHTNSLNHAYSEIVKNEGQAINFDNGKYKIMFVKCDADGNVSGYQSWKTETPQTAPQTYEYFRVQANVLVNGTLDTDYLENSVYYVTENTCEVVKKVLANEEKIKDLEKSCCFVDSVNGIDTNEGTADSPFKTIQKGIDAGTEIVYVAPGEYCEAVKVQNRDNIAIMPTTYSATFVSGVDITPKIHLDCSGDATITTSAFTIADCGNVEVVGVWTDNTKSNGFFLNRTKNVKFVDCIASNTSGEGSCGFKIQSTNGTFYGCEAYGIALDGFNIHGYGRTEFFNCIAHDCGDDGISHHDGCTGSVIGGEYFNCGKGGVATPTYGAYIDVHDVCSYNNRYGLYASSDSSRRISKGKVSNCVFSNNETNDLYINSCEIKAWNNIYGTKSISATGILTEFN